MLKLGNVLFPINTFQEVKRVHQKEFGRQPFPDPSTGPSCISFCEAFGLTYIQSISQCEMRPTEKEFELTHSLIRRSMGLFKTCYIEVTKIFFSKQTFLLKLRKKPSRQWNEYPIYKWFNERGETSEVVVISSLLCQKEINDAVVVVQAEIWFLLSRWNEKYFQRGHKIS